MTLLKVLFPEKTNESPMVFNLENTEFKELRVKDGKLFLTMTTGCKSSIMAEVESVGNTLVNMKLYDNGKKITDVCYYQRPETNKEREK